MHDPDSTVPLAYFQPANKRISFVLGALLEEMGIAEVGDLHRAHLVLPQSYSDRRKLHESLTLAPHQVYLFLPGIDRIDRKCSLWKNVSEFYGEETTSLLVPRTFLLHNDETRREFAAQRTGTFIIKTESEDGRCIRASSNISRLIQSIDQQEKKRPYTVAQRAIDAPLTIEGRAFKTRMFVLLESQEGNLKSHLYPEGLLYYAQELWDAARISEKNLIAHSYWYRSMTLEERNSFLQSHPLTTRMFEEHLAKLGIDYSDLEVRIVDLVKKVLRPFSEKDWGSFHLGNRCSVCLCGIDLIFDAHCQPWFIELNKKPAMSVHGHPAVFHIKRNVWRDTIRLLFPKRYPQTRIRFRRLT